MKRLNVYYEKILVGYLTENDKQELCFTYTAEWLQYDRAIALSSNIYLSEKIFYGENVQSFFENLLPEGDILDFISQAVHISSNNVFGLLERFGGDTAGAFSILPEAIKPATDSHYLPVEKQQIREWFQQTKGLPLNLNGEQSRMSLSGAQDKMTVLIDAAGVISIPLGAAASTHIIKPSINHRLDIPHTAINELMLRSSRL
jgi:serine/threonine-protein kinase HipA